MAVNYILKRNNTTLKIKDAGRLVKFTRAGETLTTSYALEIESETADQGSSQSTPTSLLAQTQLVRKQFMVAATTTPLRVGDVMTAGTVKYVLKKVSDVAPGGITLYTDVEVV